MPESVRRPQTASDDGRELLTLENVGPKIRSRFVRAGITSVSQLRGREPIELFHQLEAAAGRPEDPCLLDTVMSAIDQAEGKPARPWWTYTAERKRLLHQRA